VVEIDPLKINVAAVSEVMSRAFAERHRHIAVEVTRRRPEVVIASAEPYQRAWQGNLEHVLRKRIRACWPTRAICSAIPPSSTPWRARCAVLRAAGIASRVLHHGGFGQCISNLEQMLELGSMSEPDANDQHIVSIVDWLLQYAFEQRASDIHIEPRRDVGQGALSHRRRAEHGLRAAGAGLCRGDQPHQDSRAHGRGREAPAPGRAPEDPQPRWAARSSCACRRCPRPLARSW
jgi:hypothetical protein